MFTVSLLINLLNRVLLVGTSRRGVSSGEEDVVEVIRALNIYRSMRSNSDAVMVDSFQPLSRSDKQSVRELLGISEDVKIVERINPALVGSIQIIYGGKVYSYQNSNRLHDLKEFFLYS